MCSIYILIYFAISVQLAYFSVGSKLKYVWGDALEDPLASGPDGETYPWDLASKIAAKQVRSSRSMDSQKLISPQQTRQILLSAFAATNNKNYDLEYLVDDGGGDDDESEHENENREGYKNETKVNAGGQGQGHVNDKQSFRQGRANPNFNKRSRKVANQAWKQQDTSEGCVPSRLCPSTYNTTAPLYGMSLTSGKPVTIVQKFPDLLQQVVFQVCKTTECEVLQGECVQTYLPYLFLVLPLGPVTLTGQDYILVESGCVCQPKYAKTNDQPSAPLPFIQPLNNP